MKHMRPILAGMLAVLLCGCFASAPDPVSAPNSLTESESTPMAQAQTYSTFADVPQGIWYAEAANWCQDNGIMHGTADNLFSPDDLFTRAMLTMVLYQEADSTPQSRKATYTDVPDGVWYAPSVAWCTENGSISGYGGGRFGSDDPITREQLLSVLWRYSGSPSANAGGHFADETDISSYARTAVDWARINGIVSGMGGNCFVPQGLVTRAQAAAIFQRYFQWLWGMSPVFITHDLSPQGLKAVYQALNWEASGQLGIKISTGPLSGNCLRPEMTGELIQNLNAPVVECNSADGTQRSHSESHYRLAEELGYTRLTGVDILDKDGSLALPVKGGTWLTETYVGSRLTDYDSLVVLSHFSGHEMAGFSGAMQNLSIGLASSEGKSHIRSGGAGSTMWGASQQVYLESMAEAGKTVSEALDGKLVYINLLTQLSSDCDCEENPAQPELADIGILASRDPVALDKACIDLICAAKKDGTLASRINTSGGRRTLEYAEELGLGSCGYYLVLVGG